MAYHNKILAMDQTGKIHRQVKPLAPETLYIFAQREALFLKNEVLFRVPVIWSKFEFLNYQLEYEIIRKITMKNGFRLILALTETRLHHFEVWISQ